ncbi:hypothetical protein J2S62_000050 [Enteractinococcus fodinae]|uniref:Uncharacterized protein n=1 Tax=Enteractinococcus fodinae TaxID=684663 RepID=A0ABU2AWS4_9MICC|nr:hypothetical protein [Enteractinococcus fodinae]
MASSSAARGASDAWFRSGLYCLPHPYRLAHDVGVKPYWAAPPVEGPPNISVEKCYFFGAGITDTRVSARTSSCRRIWIG